MERIPIQKTYKLFINGQFVRSESGRSYAIETTFGKVNLCRASRKDLRNAVRAARSACLQWSTTAPLLRGQILYRLAEMMESRRQDFLDRLKELPQLESMSAEEEINAAIDLVVWYAGWTDKYSALIGTVNPVSGPYFNFSYPEPMGVVGVMAPHNSPLCGLIQTMLLPLLSGNVCVVVAAQSYGSIAMTLSEMLATSDVPNGVINILTGERSELMPILYTHMDVNGIAHPDRVEDITSEEAGTYFQPDEHNLKRCPLMKHYATDDWRTERYQPLDMSKFTEIKTVWHPSEMP